ncbi:alpha/beta hydrolase [Marinobacter nauticus]|uniref:alpha/beta hydrolase n=1 Tax=Marinobacter nauticus TaxID=2743 RepID=UPI001C99F13C|nr:alpha/beta hydrolase [Marinobacter nauticus]MBY5936642.1 alpha/beta hydrolase [Marinobacter nauticus]MBY5953870.1 alpha/beta hydrolase [Marinobacter nauticus]MBY6007663.1 alpha/beta hydrolase [Marinobacter nauticus]
MASRPTRLLLSARTTLVTLLAIAALLQTGCSSVFFYPDNATYITPDRLNLDFEDVYLDTADGENLHGWWLPALTDEPAKGTIYYLHGNAQNVSAHILNVAWLPEQGYNVFTIDYRGYGQSTGAPDIEGALHDVETGLRWLTHQEHTEERPLYLLGQSLGGALGIALASEWTQRNEQPALDGIILDGTFSGFRYIAREKLDQFWLTWPFQYPLSWTIPDDYEGTDRIADLSPVPVMVIHSVRDGIIPFEHGVRLYEAAEQPKEFLQTDTPHAATFVIPAYREAVLEFMEKGL